MTAAPVLGAERDSVVQRALRSGKEQFQIALLGCRHVCVNILPMATVGHCEGWRWTMTETLPLLAQAAVSLAQAGGDMVAPSDMMDGRVAAIHFTAPG